jgi:hypothetical protein
MTQFSWVRHRHPRLIGLASGPKVIFIIIESINIKNLIICVVNIIIFSIINIINKIINKFVKKYYQ